MHISSISGTFLVFYSLLIVASSTLKHFSSKTPYSSLPQSREEAVDDEYYHMNDLDGMVCSAAQSFTVVRHGIRYPGQEDVEEIKAVHDRLVNAMDIDINKELYKWVNPFPANNKKSLSSAGEDEAEEIGKKLGKRLMSLFSDEEQIYMRCVVSSKDRTRETAQSYWDGFIHTVHADSENDEFLESEVNDEMTRFFDLCAKYVYEVKDNATAMKEYLKFLESPHMLAIRDKIAKKLEVSSDLITTGNVRVIYLICGYEKAILGSSAWCSLLEDEDSEVLEYLGDLKHYYKNGYGHKITKQQTCPLVSEIFNDMDTAIREIETTEEGDEIEGFYVGSFFFGHAETLGPLYSALGLFKDDKPLLADNFEEQKSRKWRTSSILPFSANIVFVLYECLPEDIDDFKDSDEADYYVKVFVNDLIVEIPGCGNTYCPYKKLRKIMSAYAYNCNFKKVCKRSNQKDQPKDEL